MAANGGCERDVVLRMNEGYRAWGELKSVLRKDFIEIVEWSPILKTNCNNNNNVLLQYSILCFNFTKLDVSWRTE